MKTKPSVLCVVLLTVCGVIGIWCYAQADAKNTEPQYMEVSFYTFSNEKVEGRRMVDVTFVHDPSISEITFAANAVMKDAVWHIERAHRGSDRIRVRFNTVQPEMQDLNRILVFSPKHVEIYLDLKDASHEAILKKIDALRSTVLDLGTLRVPITLHSRDPSLKVESISVSTDHQVVVASIE